ncbi:MAG: hypothetical protein FJW38_25525 [Acidobacteria bacterium]|nr:hypothetical protein [Acidobacteriota bacterium]
MRLLEFAYFEFDLAMMGFALLFAGVGAWKSYDNLPPIPDPEAIPLAGVLLRPSNQTELWGAVRRIAGSLHCDPPDHVIVGLEPTIRCFNDPVVSGEVELAGRTLLVSLPLARLLSEAEFLSLIAAVMAKCELVPPGFEQWLVARFARWRPVVDDPLAAYFNHIGFWA